MFLNKTPGVRRRRPNPPEPIQPVAPKSDLPPVLNLNGVELLALLLIRG